MRASSIFLRSVIRKTTVLHNQSNTPSLLCLGYCRLHRRVSAMSKLCKILFSFAGHTFSEWWIANPVLWKLFYFNFQYKRRYMIFFRYIVLSFDWLIDWSTDWLIDWLMDWRLTIWWNDRLFDWLISAVFSRSCCIIMPPVFFSPLISLRRACGSCANENAYKVIFIWYNVSTLILRSHVKTLVPHQSYWANIIFKRKIFPFFYSHFLFHFVAVSDQTTQRKTLHRRGNPAVFNQQGPGMPRLGHDVVQRRLPRTNFW